VKSNPRKGLKLRKLVIDNYKALDHLELEFPEPRMPDDPDMVVIGSENGVGKTSVLECCALIVMACEPPELGEAHLDFDTYELEVDPYELVIRSGCKEASIHADLRVGDSRCGPTLSMMRGTTKVAEEVGDVQDYFKDVASRGHAPIEDRVRSLLGFDTDPLVQPGLVYFHSYRKVQEGRPELGMMVDERHSRRPGFRKFPQRKPRSLISAFKLEIVRLMMSKADLFEEQTGEQAASEYQKLNELLGEYAGVTLEKLRPLRDSSVEIRLQPKTGEASYSFDGLSSGQKEIISTLFLIWRHAKQTPGIILIDEPELHLNAGWHRPFMKRLLELAPNSQFILATHSRDVFESIPLDRRILLEPSKGVLVS